MIKFRKFKTISIFLCVLLLSAFAGTDSMVLGQSSNLPRAYFPKYSQNSNQSQYSSRGGRGSYGSPSTDLNQIRSTPGVHITRGESRTPQTANEPYNPGEEKLNMQWVRWPRSKMPLRVWISPGLQLPKMPFNKLQATRVEQVFQMMANRYPLDQLPVANGWTPETNYQVAAGIEQWRIFEQEGLLKFGFTTNPYDAHIVVFFTDNFQGTTGPGGIIVGANTAAQLFTPQQLRDPKYKQKPVVIEFSLKVNFNPEKLQGSSAHEFGHALGIKAHSPYREDIMYRDRVVNQLSEGDKATLRLLYKSKTPYLM